MTSASISSSSAKPATPARAAPQHGQSRPEPKPDDLRAMRDAFASARRQPPADGQGKLLRQQVGKRPLVSGREGQSEERAETGAAAARGRDPLQDDARYERDQQQGNQGFAMLSQNGGFVPLPMTSPPPPTVDPSAFAQMMAQLWTRENGKGAREVRVRFGESTWPATGARLVRNAAGTIDVELYMGAHGADENALDGLRRGFAERGVALGALEVGQGEA